MGLYKDIISEMQRQGFEVDFLAEGNYRQDPLNVRGYKGIKKYFLVNAKKFSVQMEKYWMKTLSSPSFNKIYDYLFVLDGQSLHPCIFEILRKRNSNVKCINYLFDTTEGVYRFNENFKFFDKVVTFDRKESTLYGIELMPIFWFDDVKVKGISYKFFGVGAFKKDRYKLFWNIAEFAKNNNASSYIKLISRKSKFFRIKSALRQVLNLQQDRITLKEFNSDIVAHEYLNLNDFNRLLSGSEIILDTNDPKQDGLTARFMQALGNKKKIVTTNKSVELYSFYTPEQIFIVNDIDSFASSESFRTFVSQKLELNEDIIKQITKTRIDNWVKFMLDAQ